MNQLLIIDTVAFFVLSFQPVEYDTPTDAITVCTSGQWNLLFFNSSRDLNFLASEPIYF